MLGVTDRGNKWKTRTFTRCSTRRVLAPASRYHALSVCTPCSLSPLPSTPSLYPVARPLTIFRSRCLNLLKRRTSRGISTRICPPEQEMVETMVAQLAEAFPRPWRKVTILHR